MTTTLDRPILAGTPERRQARRELITYFGMTFTITWGLGALILLAKPRVEAVIGPIGPLNQSWLYFVAVSAPSLAALVLSLAFGGLSGLKTLAAGLVRPVNVRWVAVAILAYPAGVLAWGLVERVLGVSDAAAGVDVRALLIGAPVLALTTPVLFTDPGAFGEELGWRGFALPRLLRLFDGGASALILGVVWGVWHIPAFFAEGLAQSGFNFGWFLLGIVSMSVVMTWIYLHANGNVLVAGVLPHAVFNLLFDAHVFRVVPKIEAIVLAAMVLAILGVRGPTLRGWRRR